MNQPLVTIVVPSYNHDRFIAKTIQSVLGQTYINWELIIIDNFSSDQTDSIISCITDERIRVLKIHNDGIIAVSRNKGISEAKGEWIAFLDSDDFWYNSKLENVMLLADQADLIYHDMDLYMADYDKILEKAIKSRKLTNPVFRDLLINGNVIINSSVVVRKSLLIEVNVLNENRSMITAEDYNLWLKLAQKTNRFVYISKRLGYYTIHSSGLSQKDRSKQLRYAIAEFLSLLTKKEKKFVESFIRYSRIRTIIRSRYESICFNDFIYCVINGTLEVKIKTIFSLFQIILFFKKK
jgi:glycosyltransferase involved in cell wall biosynthesis